MKSKHPKAWAKYLKQEAGSEQPPPKKLKLESLSSLQSADGSTITATGVSTSKTKITEHFKSLPSPSTIPKAAYVTKERITECILCMVTCSSRPLTMVQDKWFRKLVAPSDTALGMNITYCFVIDCINDAYTELTDILEQVTKNRILCLKSNCVTRVDRSFIGVNIQFAYKGEIFVITLRTIELNNHHTGQNLKNALTTAMKKFNITVDQIYTVTTDNGADLCKAARLMEKATNEVTKKSMSDDCKDNNEGVTCEWNEDKEYYGYGSEWHDDRPSDFVDEFEDALNLICDIEDIKWDGNILMSEKEKYSIEFTHHN